MGSITKNENVEVYFSVNDIINGLEHLSNSELKHLYNAIEKNLDISSLSSINVTTLYDEMKMKTLVDIYDKYSLNELDQFLKNKKEGYGV